MFSKKIKPLAIVPQELYVIRHADLQLKQIIEDMGRPGYVLVSRQMGKTNLLLNAKREIDSADSCFSYLDVSNCFPDLRSFFRNIIDTTILARDDLTGWLLEKIGGARQGTVHLQPHKEHELELKTILDHLSGKLVICLDEIDALTNVDYSDNVFSLIRSIYFSGRTNYPQFKRLTYVLSGVADPAELIKNKAISPFNIGEKIYLDDFTLSETKKFLSQCNLIFSDEVIERIYYWTSGNPRVTWDLCSAAENVLNENNKISDSDIDKLVTSLYLKSHDLPPFDHIRTRVQLDKELRNSVIAMHYGKSLSLSDKVKDRLYLSGISTPKQENGEISFKNKIMSESLSEKWISDIESELLTLEERANEKVKLKRYDEAIALYEEHLLQADGPEQALATKLNIGFCYIQNRDISAAIAEYESCNTDDVRNQGLLNAKRHWSGVCYMFSDRFDDAALQFREILESKPEKKKGSFYPEACINLASLWLAEYGAKKDDKALVNPEIEELLKKAIGSTERQEAQGKSQADNAILYTAHYQLSRYYNLTDELGLSSQHLDHALEVSDSDVKSTLLYERATYEDDPHKQAYYYIRCAENIIEAQSPISDGDIMNQLSFGARDCSALLGKLVRHNHLDEAKKLFEYLCSQDAKNNSSAFEIINATITACLQEHDYKPVPNLARLALTSNEAPPEGLRILVTLGILLRDSDEKTSKTDLYDKYIDLYLRPDDAILTNTDFRVIYDIFHLYLNEKLFGFCSELLNLSKKALEHSSTTNPLPRQTIDSGDLLLLFLEVRLSITTDDKPNLPNLLTKYTSISKNMNEFALSYFPDDFYKSLEQGFKAMFDKAFAMVRPAEHLPFRADKKFGRNQIILVKYLDGSVRQGKYKKFVIDLENERCTIIDG